MLIPDPVWVTAAVLLTILYVGGLLWVRSAARGISLQRVRRGTLIVAGDELEEEYLLVNRSAAPMTWIEVIDESDLPGYEPGRVLSVGAKGSAKWRTKAQCKQRGLFRLGPHRLVVGDPLGLFDLTLHYDQSEPVLIYPRVTRAPLPGLPRGYTSGDERRLRPFPGPLPSATIRNFVPGDDLRFVHWPSTAHKGSLFVREIEQEPSGDIWIVLDAFCDAQVHQGDLDTLETGVSAAAGIAMQLLDHGRRGVGLVTTSGAPASAVTVAPRNGRAHVWPILTALAPVRFSDLGLDALLEGVPGIAGSRSTLVLITPSLAYDQQVKAWVAQVVRASARGLGVSVLLVTADRTQVAAEAVRSQLLEYGISVELLSIDVSLPAMLTQRRRRKELRSTPSGGVVTVEVEDEIG
jgi:uncharacterized protein (DUF58 family)